MSFSAHKTYGPKGVGAPVRPGASRVRIEAQMHGGGHERGMRSGTLPTHQIVGMGEAFRIAKLEMATENERIRMLRDRLWQGLSEMDEVYVNGNMEHRVPHNLNASFNFVEGESLIMAITRTSRCRRGRPATSASLEPSYGAAGAGAQRRTGAQLDTFSARPLHQHRGGRGLHDCTAEAQGRKVARTVPALGNASGWRRLSKIRLWAAH